MDRNERGRPRLVSGMARLASVPLEKPLAQLSVRQQGSSGLRCEWLALNRCSELATFRFPFGPSGTTFLGTSTHREIGEIMSLYVVITFRTERVWI